MNRDAVLFHLGEAKEELGSTIAEIESNPEYGFEELQVAISHLYHHINTAWNGRDVSLEAFQRCSQEDFDKWRKFPDYAELWLD